MSSYQEFQKQLVLIASQTFWVRIVVPVHTAVITDVAMSAEQIKQRRTVVLLLFLTASTSTNSLMSLIVSFGFFFVVVFFVLLEVPVSGLTTDSLTLI